MRLIDADKLMKAMYHRAFETDGDTMWQSGCWVRYRAIEQVVKEQPTIEPERKTGRWIAHPGGKFVGFPYMHYECDQCRNFEPTETNYCPHCGAYMGGDT